MEKSSKTNLTLQSAIHAYLDSVALARSRNTTRTYRNGLTVFLNVL